MLVVYFWEENPRYKLKKVTKNAAKKFFDVHLSCKIYTYIYIWSYIYIYMYIHASCQIFHINFLVDGWTDISVRYFRCLLHFICHWILPALSSQLFEETIEEWIFLADFSLEREAARHSSSKRKATVLYCTYINVCN